MSPKITTSLLTFSLLLEFFATFFVDMVDKVLSGNIGSLIVRALEGNKEHYCSQNALNFNKSLLESSQLLVIVHIFTTELQKFSFLISFVA